MGGINIDTVVQIADLLADEAGCERMSRRRVEHLYAVDATETPTPTGEARG